MDQKREIKDELDLKDLIKIVFRYKWSITFITLFFTFAAAIFAYYKPNIYQATATLELESEKNLGARGDIVSQALNSGGISNLDTEKEVIKSRFLVQHVIKKLELNKNIIGVNKYHKKLFFYKNTPLDIKVLEGDLSNKVFTIIPKRKNSFELEIPSKGIKKEYLFGKKIVVGDLSFIIEKKSSRLPDTIKKYIISFNDPKYYADNIRNSSLSVASPSRSASILEIRYIDTIPQRAKDFVDVLTKEYMKQSLQRKTQEATFTLDFVNKQLEIIKKNLERASKNLEQFKQKNKTVDVKESIAQISAKLAEYENQQNILAMKIQGVREVIKQIKKGKLETLTLAGLGLEDQSIAKLISQLQEAIIAKKELLKNYTPSHPEVTKISARITQLKTIINRSVKNVLSNLLQQKRVIDKKLKALEKKLQTLPKQEQDYIGLERSFLFNEKFYTYLMEKKTETEIKKAATISKNRILDSALLPKHPIKPQRKKIVAIGFILGLILGVTFALVRAFLDNSIKEESDIKEKTNAPILGIIPEYKDAKEQRRLVVLESPKSPVAEAFRNIRTNIEFMLKNRKHNVIAVTSTVAKEGKTSVTANLAGALHLLKKRVLIISLDLRKPTLHKLFDISNTKGVSSYLSGAVSKEEIILKTKYEYIDIIPSGPVPPNPNELIASQELSELIEELKKEYDYVLLDTPPIGLVADTKVIIKHSDLTIYLLKANYSKKEFINLINDLYEHEKTNLGVVINGVKVSKKGYGYSYGYSYGSGYGYGYY